MKHATLVLSLLTFAACGGGAAENTPAEIEPESNLEGPWEMVHLSTPEGPDESIRGHLLVSGNFVCHVRVSKERVGFEEGETDESRTAKAAQLFNQQAAACGTFEQSGDSLTVRWLSATNPGTEGNATEYVATVEGDQLSLAAAAATDFAFVYRRP